MVSLPVANQVALSPPLIMNEVKALGASAFQINSHMKSIHLLLLNGEIDCLSHFEDFIEDGSSARMSKRSSQNIYFPIKQK